MADPLDSLVPLLRSAMAEALGPEHGEADPVLRRSAQDRFGDYQANAAMALAKGLGRPPRQVAEAIAARLEGAEELAKVEVAGPGFINLTLDEVFLGAEVAATAADPRLGVTPVLDPQRFVVDYGGPNVAKELLVHHMRSAVIGDAAVRILDHLGHHVVRQDHMGDWGRQFGMLIEHLVDLGWDADPARPRSIRDLNELYRQAQAKFDGDEAFGRRSRQRVVALQGGDPTTLALWRALVEESERHFQAVYRRLGLTIGPEDLRPESFYNPMLDDVVGELESRGLLRMDDGALCAFPEGFVNREGQPLPLIVRNSEGGYGYAATDLAAVKYSVEQLDGDRLVYFTDARQAQHFAMVFAVAATAGWLDRARAEHAPFGSVVGPDGKPFKTRSGDVVRLAELLDEAVARADAVVADKSPDLDPAARSQVAEAVGIGGIKYNDLSSDRVKDVVFDWDRMLAREGNTAPYLQYAHARIRSIFRRAGTGMDAGAAGRPGLKPAVVIGQAEERSLALALLGFPSAVRGAAETLQPHRLCTYLFDLASTFTTFYEACPVLRVEEPLRSSRLVLCHLTADILATGLALLGIEAPPRM
jgi:arginyl-tRNA synthetase